MIEEEKDLAFFQKKKQVNKGTNGGKNLVKMNDYIGYNVF